MKYHSLRNIESARSNGKG